MENALRHGTQICIRARRDISKNIQAKLMIH